jgi:hypothetical protein
MEQRCAEPPSRERETVWLQCSTTRVKTELCELSQLLAFNFGNRSERVRYCAERRLETVFLIGTIQCAYVLPSLMRKKDFLKL